jgi:uncharacterized Fe-S radical SAM superfamily protein PflX
MRHAEYLADGTDVFERIEYLRTLRLVTGQPCRQLPTVLKVQQHLRQHGGNIIRTGGFTKPIHSRYATIMMNVFAQDFSFSL